jgi:hypothetical protein
VGLLEMALKDLRCCKILQFIGIYPLVFLLDFHLKAFVRHGIELTI